MQHLFVYGTLVPTQPNEHILAPINGTWRSATIRGKHYPDGIGATMCYPAVRPNQDGEIIQGLVFSSNDLDRHWHRIDDFEGEGYQRVDVETILQNGKKRIAFVYALHPRERAEADNYRSLM